MLRIRISIAPSREWSMVFIETKPSTPQTKQTHATKAEETETPDDEPVAKRVRFDPDVATIPSSTATITPLKEHEIIQIIQKALPPILEKDELKLKTSYLSKTIGSVVLDRYTVKSKADCDCDFVMTLATADEAMSYHSKVQPLALWYIENADIVDMSSSDDGFWKVLYLFQQKSENQLALAGYVTLFHFRAPFRKPRPGIVCRVCQALLLPPYQRQGHGERMMKAVYRDLPKDVVEINVEDPAPGFVQLRNKVDYLRFRDNVKEWLPQRSVVDDNSWIPLSGSEVVHVASEARIIANQVHIGYELWRLSGVPDAANDECLKLFRLMVKKRLLRTFKEELAAIPSKEQRKVHLGKVFHELLSGYCQVLKRTVST